MSGLLEGRATIITGAARGIGLAIGRRLSEQGAAAIVADLDESAAREAAGHLPGPAFAAACDATVSE